MKIVLLGYGKMGKIIEQTALERNHEVVLTIDKDNVADFTQEKLKEADVAIEFSTPETAFDNYLKCFDANLPVVTGTTGWLDKRAKLEEICKNKKQKFFYASNFSVGVNVFFQINKKLAELLANHSEYVAEIFENHHIHKLDAPSGTAISLAEQIIIVNPKYTNWENKLKTEHEYNLPIVSYRENEVPGTHLVRYQSEVDNIEIRHEAHSRKGFALGAVLAAEFLVKKQTPGCYSMDDLLQF